MARVASDGTVQSRGNCRGYAPKKGKHNGLCDVTRIVVTEGSNLEGWLCCHNGNPSAIRTMAKASIRGGDLMHHTVWHFRYMLGIFLARHVTLPQVLPLLE